MYYSKGSQTSFSIPQNYSGNTFRVIDESERTYIPPTPQNIVEEKIDLPQESKDRIESKNENKISELPFVSSFLQSISVEDLLLLGLIFVIHQNNPNDEILLLLLILLLAK